MESTAIELFRLKTVRFETAQGIVDVLSSFGYIVEVRPGPLDLAHILTDSDTYMHIKPVIDELILDDGRWTTVNEPETGS